jgi:hypothetical protein
MEEELILLQMQIILMDSQLLITRIVDVFIFQKYYWVNNLQCNRDVKKEPVVTQDITLFMVQKVKNLI